MSMDASTPVVETPSAPAPVVAEKAPPPADRAPANAEKPAEPETAAEKAEAENQALDDDLRKVWEKANKARDEAGRFAAKDGKPPAEKAEAKPEKVEAEAKPEKVEAKEPPKPAIAPPRSWKKDVAEKWATLPPDVQQYVAEREEAAHRTISEHGQFRSAMEPVAKVLWQHKDVFERNGTDFTNGVAALITAQQALDQNPVNGLANLARMYGVDLRTVVQQMYGTDVNPAHGLPPDPEIVQLKAELAQMKRETEHARQQQTAQQKAATEAQREAQLTSLERQIGEFAKDRPHFDEASAEILANLQVIMQSNPHIPIPEVLQTAYDRAIWANPRTRAAEQSRIEAERLKQAAEQAAQAKRASSINVRSAPKATEPGDLDDDLRSVWRRANAR